LVLSRCATFDVDPVSERTDVQQICRLDGKWLSASGPGNHPLVGKATRFAMVSADQSKWVLDSSTCTLQEVQLPPNTATERIEIINLSDLAVLFTVNGALDLPTELIRFDLLTGELKRFRLPKHQQAALPLQFSKDGMQAVWITDPGTEHEEVHVAPVGEPQPEFSFFPGARLGLGTYQLVDVDRSGQGIVLQRTRGQYLFVDTSGSLINTLRPDDGILPWVDNIRFSHDGKNYLAWDNYQEPSVIQWGVGEGIVHKDLPKDSTVVSAAVSSDWKWIAASVQANTKSGRGVESLTVWSPDGSVRFHKRLRRGARTPVVLLQGDLVGYNEVDEKWHATTRIVKLTATSPSSGSESPSSGSDRK
jgi:hypothetical protein